MRSYVAAILLTAFVCTPSFAHLELKSEQNDERWLKVSADLPFALFGAYIGRGEFKISKRMSFLVNGGYVDPRISIKPSLVNSFQFGGDGLVGVKIGAGARWYPFDGCMDGIFFEDIIDTDILWTYSGNAIVYAPGVTNGPVDWVAYNSFHIGYSWVTEIGFFADAAAGINSAVLLTGAEAPPGTYSLKFYGFGGSSPDGSFTEPINRIEARLAVGWAF